MQISYKPKTQSSLNLPRQSFASVSKSSLFSADIDVEPSFTQGSTTSNGRPISVNLKDKENDSQVLNKSSGLTAAEVIKLHNEKKEALKLRLNAERSTAKDLREKVAVLKKDLNAAKEMADAKSKERTDAEKRVEVLLIELEKYRAAEKRKSESDVQSLSSDNHPDKKHSLQK